MSSFEIGGMTLHHGDCLDLMTEIGAVDHIITDPPYEAFMHNAKTANDKQKDQKSAVKLAGTALDFDSIDAIRADFVTAAAKVCNGWFLAFCTPEGIAPWANEINASAMKYKRACIWVKPDATPQLNGQGPAMGAECFVAAWASKGHARWNAGGKRGVYTHCVNGGNREKYHPTQKPVSLMCELIRDFTDPGDTILDPFAGSGTTGIACHKLGRKFIGIEKSPKHFEAACRRLSKHAAQRDFFVPDHAPSQERFDL